MRTLIALSAVLALCGCEETNLPHVLNANLVDAACQEEMDSRDGDVDAASISVTVSGSSILVDLIGAEANCCPTPAMDAEVDEDLITVNFIDVTNEDEVCDCICPTDFSSEIEDVDPGSYTVEVSFLEVLVDSAEVEVE